MNYASWLCCLAKLSCKEVAGNVYSAKEAVWLSQPAKREICTSSSRCCVWQRRERKTSYLSNRIGGCPNITHRGMAWNCLLAISNLGDFSTGAVFHAALFCLPSGGHSWRPGSVGDSASKEHKHTDVKKGWAVSRGHQLSHYPKKSLIHRVAYQIETACGIG